MATKHKPKKGVLSGLTDPQNIRSRSLDIGHGYFNPLADDVREFTMETDDDIDHTLISRKGSLDTDKAKKKGSRGFCQPSGTLPYIASNRDSLDRIAAHHNTTPSELMRLNKLATRMIFPGQELYVPDPNAPKAVSLSPNSPSIQEQKENDQVITNSSALSGTERPKDIPVIMMKEKSNDKTISTDTEMKGQKAAKRDPLVRSKSAPKPGRVIRQKQISIDSPVETEYFEKFLKINVKYITDGQGVVSGVLLVTPNAIMFDPNVSDSLVIENGADMYGIITPMDMVVSAAMYHDIAPMKEKNSNAEVYHAQNCPLARKKKKMDEVDGAVPAEKSSENVIEDETSMDNDDVVVNTNDENDRMYFDHCSCGIDTKQGDNADSENGNTKQGDDTDTGNGDMRQGDKTDTGNADTKQGDITAMENVDTKQADVLVAENDEVVNERHKQTEDELLEEIDKELKSDDKKIEESVQEKAACIDFHKSDENPSEQEHHVIELNSKCTDTDNQSQVIMDKQTSEMDVENVDGNKEAQKDVASLDTGDTSSLDKGSVESGIAEMNDTVMTDEHIDVVTETGHVITESSDFTPDISDTHQSGDVSEQNNSKALSEERAETCDREMDVSEIDEKVDNEGASDLNGESKKGITHVESIENNVQQKDEPRTPEDETHDSNSSKSEQDTHSSDPFVETDTKTKGKLCDEVDPKTETADNVDLNTAQSDEVTVDGQDDGEQRERTRSFVDFSSGLFSKEQEDPKSPIPDITEVIRDTSATLQEIERIKASARRIRITPRHRQKSDSEFEIDRKDRARKQLERLASWDTNYHAKSLYRELILRPKPMDEPPLYLCLKVGKPMKKTFSSSSAIESYSNKTKKPEYWFAVPRDRADHLYAFFVQWSPNIYGKEDPDAKEMGFVVLEEEDAPIEIVEDFFNDPVSKDWEIVTYEEAKRRLSLLEGEDLPLPELLNKSNVLDNEQVSKLMGELPPRVEGYSWSLIYSTYEHGFSLKTLYRSMDGYDSPVLLIVKDSDNFIFGALLSTPIKVSDHFYGTGETFLYTLLPEFKKYPWTGNNNFFVKGDFDSLAIGGGDGNFGLWLDGGIYHGSSHHCQTFENQSLSAKEDFVIQGLEAWGFV
ncbi:LOW QUALITY PROTEIN: oxidation resistance protein 1-like [Ptychodera flava]|uniref:LOW QUALITY PROTEIN: oxidation resistance protein 1-like n=1 Tax=Ptychodera flava TaxID=63121 RepID=UPI00396A0B63